MLITLKGFKRNTKDYKDYDPKNRFLVLVPAHNEEKVISGIIKNLKNMEYPKELYDFYIIADNCSDSTATVAKQMGANVLELTKESEDEATGKPVALKKAFERLTGYQDKYDIIMFFDADNLIDPDMFKEVNSQMIDHPEAEVIQCYLGAKNKKGIVASFYYISYTITNRFFQYSKNRFNLNSVIGGTGFAVRSKYIYKRGGWSAMSLTEDFELQIEATVDGKKVLWNNNVRVYDEKPTSLKASFKQRKRWAQGHWFVALKNTKKLFRSFRDKRISLGEFISTLVYMYSFAPYLMIIFQLPIILLINVLQLSGVVEIDTVNINNFVMSNLFGLITFFYSYIVVFFIADYWDNGNRFSFTYMFQLIFVTIVNSVLITLASVAGFMHWKQQSVWVKTEHKIDHLQAAKESLSDGHKAAAMLSSASGEERISA